MPLHQISNCTECLLLCMSSKSAQQLNEHDNNWERQTELSELWLNEQSLPGHYSMAPGR